MTSPAQIKAIIYVVAALLFPTAPFSAAFDAMSSKPTAPPGAGKEGATAPTEVVPGFSETESNGLVSEDEFADLRKDFSNEETVLPTEVDCPPPKEGDKKKLDGGGLGPLYNGVSCASCHHNPVMGGSSQVAVMRAGHMDRPSKPGGDQTFKDHPGGSLVHQRSTSGLKFKKPNGDEVNVPTIAKHLTAGDNVHTLRMSTNLLGLGYVECIGDADLIGQQQNQFKTPFGDLHGTVLLVLASKDLHKSVQRVGRFGWKCQLGSLLDFAADAYINEMGITSPLQPMENEAEDGMPMEKFDGKFDEKGNPIQPNDPTKQEVEGKPPEEHPFGVDTEGFATFMRATKAPPRDEELKNKEEAKAGEKLFLDNQKTGCAICHVPTWVTLPKGTWLPGLLGDSKVPDALGNKIISPYSDFLLHDIGTGDGIVQRQHAQRPPISSANVELLTMQRNGIDNLSERTLGIIQPFAVDAAGAGLKAKVWEEHSLKGGIIQAFSDDVVKTAPMIRTTPLWGLRTKLQLLHDGSALNVHDAIMRHRGQAAAVQYNYAEVLSEAERKQLLAFLSSL